MNNIHLHDDDFTLLGLPQKFALDWSDLDERWLALQAQVHPDRFAAEGAAAQRLAMQWSMRVNQAYERLKHPLTRAQYLCELRGAAVQAQHNTAMPAAFLQQQMQWREALDEARDAAAMQALDDEVGAQERRLYQRLEALLDAAPAGRDADAAAAQVRALMFIDRFRADVARRLEALQG